MKMLLLSHTSLIHVNVDFQEAAEQAKMILSWDVSNGVRDVFPSLSDMLERLSISLVFALLIRSFF